MGPDSNGTQSLQSSKAGTTHGLNQAIPTIPDYQRHVILVAEPTQAARYTLRSYTRAARGRDHSVTVPFNDPSTVDKPVETSSVSTLNLSTDHPAWVPDSVTCSIAVNMPVVSVKFQISL